MAAPKKNQNARKPKEDRKTYNLTIPLTASELEAVDLAIGRSIHRKRAQWGREIIRKALNEMD